MKLAEITFSPTGGTQKVADIITEELGGAACRIDLTDGKANFLNSLSEAKDLAVIAVPSYGGRVPALAAGRIRQLSGHQTPCVLVCVYGNRAYEDTLVELSDLAAASGFHVVAAIAAVAEHSILRQYAANRPDGRDEAELRAFAKRIVEKCSGCMALSETLRLPGNRPYRKAGGAGLVPKAGKQCTSCGRCAEQCPAQAISYENNRMTDHTRCISCMRCLSVCPHAARSLNQVLVSAAALAMKRACSERKENELFL